MPKKSRRFFNALYMAAVEAGLQAQKSTVFQPCQLLVVYGPGGADRHPFIQQHLAGGGSAILFDLGYWARDGETRKYRVSINGLHPTREQLYAGPDPGPARYQQTGKPILVGRLSSDSRNVLLIGNAPKSCAIGARGWTETMATKVRQLLPDMDIIWRPKPKRPRELRIDHDQLSQGPLDTDLRRSALVLCKHSNVAIDACIQGVPVVCDGGAAAAIYPSRLIFRHEQPDYNARVEFLNRLAWWQWGIDEVRQFWEWFFRSFPAYDHRQLSGSGNRPAD